MSTYRTSSAFDLPPSRLVPAPTRARRVALMLALTLVAMTLLAALAPWQQTVTGTGRIVAYAPLERQQTIEAPIDARISRFLVREGSHVETGELLVELSDNDPELFGRLEAELTLTEERVSSYDARVSSLADRRTAVASAQQSAISASEARVRVASDRVEAAEHGLSAAEADLDTQLMNLARHRVLAEQGLVSQRDLELAVLAEARARTARDGAQASRDAARGEIDVAEAALDQARAATVAEVESAISALRSAETDHQAAQAALLRMQSRLSRQSTQRVTAPRSGTILRLVAATGTEQVRAGDPLLVLVPDTSERAVELWVDGNDVALVEAGRHVRLQLEGWPAVQFAGWPSVAVGTFGGVVSFVDSTDDGRGNFRLVVLADEDDEPWPDPRFLRQGVRANAWVLLDQVSLGFELWRRLNGFPPTVRTHPSSAPARPGSPGYGGAGYGGAGYGGAGYGGDEEGGGYGGGT